MVQDEVVDCGRLSAEYSLYHLADQTQVRGLQLSAGEKKLLVYFALARSLLSVLL